MNTKKFFILRHGQTEFNKKGIVQGRGVDSSLNQVGQGQAQKFYQAYKHMSWDWVYTSALKRTHQSVKSFIDDGIGHTPLEGLDEIHWGSKEGKPFSENDHIYYKEVTRKWREGATHQSIAGGESPEEVLIRQQAALEHIMQNTNQQNILICMHGRAMRIFMCLLLNYPLRSMDLFQHYNTGVYKLTFTGGIFRMDDANNLEHLQ